MEGEIWSVSSSKWWVVCLLYRARFWYSSCLSEIFAIWISLLGSFHLWDFHLYILPVTPTHHIGPNSVPHLDISHHVQSSINCDLEVCTDHCAMPVPWNPLPPAIIHWAQSLVIVNIISPSIFCDIAWLRKQAKVWWSQTASFYVLRWTSLLIFL